MNRKDFIEKLIWAGAAFGATASGFAAGDLDAHSPDRAGSGPAWRRGRRRVTDWSSEIDALPEDVFPLLCPVREYEWLEGWASEMIYSESGVAEENCVFQTHFHGRSATWTVSRYEPPVRIEFVIVTPDLQAARLNISLERTAKGTLLRWNRIFTGLSEKGNETIDSWRTSSDQSLSKKIERFIKNGKMKVGN